MKSKDYMLPVQSLQKSSLFKACSEKYAICVTARWIPVGIFAGSHVTVIFRLDGIGLMSYQAVLERDYT